MPRLVNWYTWTPERIKGEANAEPSLTVPNETMSLGELLRRFTKGQAVATLEPVFLNDDFETEMPDVGRMEFDELAALKSDIDFAIAEKQKSMSARRQKDVKKDSVAGETKPKEKPPADVKPDQKTDS